MKGGVGSMKRNNRRHYDKVAPWLLPIGIIVIWQLSSSLGILGESILPSPYAIVLAAIDLTVSGEIFTHLFTSATRAITGFFIGGLLGLILGIANGTLPFFQKHLDTTVQMVRNIPNLALVPLVIIWFGVGETAKVFLVAAGVFFPIYINTYHGIRNVDKNLIEMGKVYGLPRTKLFTKIILPGALSSILVGIRYSLGVMWLTLIVAETLAASSGIGYMSSNAREFMQLDIVVLAILMYALLGKVADSLAKSLESLLLQWNPVYAHKK